jgi:hypothetical protein
VTRRAVLADGEAVPAEGIIPEAGQACSKLVQLSRSR